MNVKMIFCQCKPIKCSPIHSNVLISKFYYITLFNKENKIENVNARYVRNSIIYKINIIGQNYELDNSKQNYNEFIYTSIQFIKITRNFYAME